jgi:hypothetical protein
MAWTRTKELLLPVPSSDDSHLNGSSVSAAGPVDDVAGLLANLAIGDKWQAAFAAKLERIVPEA